MNSSHFKSRQLQYLASLLHCASDDITYLCENIGSYYGKRIEYKTKKGTDKIKTYLDGTPKQRIIRPSYQKLKRIQGNIKNNILAPIVLPPNVYGGVKGKSNVTNANKHKGNKYVLTTDLQEFFPGISSRQIHQMYLDIGYSHHVAYWLTKLTSIEFELPQGTPTSTHVANLVFLSTDLELIKLCKSNEITYTRYVDDLTFSSQKDFQHLIPQILSVVISSGFKISRRKTSYHRDQTITGINVFNNYIDAPDKIKNKLTQNTVESISLNSLKIYVNNIRKLNIGAKTKEQQRTTLR